MPGEQTLAVELLGLMTIQTARSITEKKGLPHPRTYVGALAAYGILSLVGKVSPSAAKFADVMGAVILLAYVLTWTAKSPTGVKDVLKLPGTIATGNLPTKPEAANHKGLSILGQTLEILGLALVGSKLIGGAAEAAGAAAGGAAAAGAAGANAGTVDELATEPGATVGELTIPEVLTTALEGA